MSALSHPPDDPWWRTPQAQALISALTLVVPFLALMTWGAAQDGPRLAASNAKVTASRIAIPLEPDEERCQAGEFVPAQAGYVRMYARFSSEPGSLQVEVRDAEGRVRSSGELTGADSGPVMVPIRSPEAPVSRGRLCIRNSDDGEVSLAGDLTPLNPQTAVGPPSPGAGPDDEIRADFYYAEHRSWFDMAGTVADRFALFKPSFVGAWTLPVVLLLALFASLVGGWLVIRSALGGGSRRRAIAAGLFGVTAAAGLGWALTTPPYQVPDEFSHVEYAEYIGDYGELPPIVDDDRREARDRRDDHGEIYYGMPFSVEGQPSWDPEDDRVADERMRLDLPTSHASGPGGASSGPPAYYAIQGAVAVATDPLPPVDRLFAMRLVSVIMAALLVLAVHAFLREVLPGRPLVAAVGALAVSLHPVVGFLSGGVSNDNLLYLLAACLLALVARGFNRGLLPLTAIGIGVTLGLGELTKSRSILMLPATLLGLGLMVFAARGKRLRTAGSAALALGVFAVIDGVWLAVSRSVLSRSTAGTSSVATDAGNQVSSLRGVLSYVWQSFLPRLPFMEPQFTEYPHYPLWDVYIEGFVGRFGWFQYGFPRWVSIAGFAVLCCVAALALTALARRRHAVRRRWPELLTYLAYATSLPVFLAVAAYDYRNRTGYNLEQTRYLFPLLALYAGAVALALLAVPRRWRPAASGALVGLFAVHTLASFLLTVDRYYL